MEKLNLGPIVTGDLESMALCCQDIWQRFEGKNLLITGGGGFLGYYFSLLPLFLNQYSARKTQVFLLDRKFPRWAQHLSRVCPELTLLEQDVQDTFACKDGDFHWIIHAASLASPVFYRRFPLQTLRANVGGLEAILEYARGRAVEGILFLSTSEVYGNPPDEKIPTAEDFPGLVSTTGPRACYDESKRLAETLAVIYHREYGTPVKITRPFNHYGPGLFPHDGRVLADFAQQILANKDILVHSDGSPTRSFCYISDGIVGHYRALALSPAATPVNVGRPDPEISIKKLGELFINLAQKHWNYSGSLRFQASLEEDYLADNPQRRCPDIGRAQKCFGFAPKVSLEDGLLRYLTWCFDTKLGQELGF